MQLFTLVMLYFLSSLAWAQTDFDRQQIQDRIKPSGSVRVEGESTPQRVPNQAPVKKAQEVVQQDPGAAIYDRHCKVCHQGGLAGAPKFRDEAMWGPRIKAKGMDQLVTNAVNGFNAMPPKGTCIKCSDADIRQAVEYMVPKS